MDRGSDFEIDLFILDSLNTARLSFKAFELIPIEAALACIEVKTTLTSGELKGSFERFEKIQRMEFFQERVVRETSDADGTGIAVAPTSRPELVLFAYEVDVSDEAIAKAYECHPTLGHVKICVLQRGIVATLTHPARELCWIVPVEEESRRRAGQVLALFVFQFLLPALHAQNKGSRFYIKYLDGQSASLAGLSPCCGFPARLVVLAQKER